MKDLLKLYWLDIALVLGFIIFTFVIPIKFISFATAVILATGLLYKVTHDERIQDPYSSIMGVVVLIVFGMIMNKIW